MAEDTNAPKEGGLVKKVLVTVPNRIFHGPRTAAVMGESWDAMMSGHPVESAKLGLKGYKAAAEDWKDRLHIGNKGKGGTEIGG